MTFDPFENELEFIAPPKRISMRASKQARAPGPAPEGAESIDLKLSFLGTNDKENAKRLIARFGRDIIYVNRLGWHVWDGVRWVGGDDGEDGARRLAQMVSDGIFKEAKALEMAIAADSRIASPDRINILLAHANTSGNTNRITAMLNEARPFLSKKIGRLDRHEDLVPCLNGTLVLGKKTTFRENRREDLMTKCVAINYTPGAAAPTFQNFLEVIQPIEEDRKFLQRVFGYTLTGFTREDKFIMLFGLGRNGKTTLAQIMRFVFGDFGAGLPVAALLRPSGPERKGGEASPELARLPGVRFVTADEPPENGRLDEGKIKKLTGGDSIETRALFKDIFEYHPAFKIFLLANYKPSIYGVDEGIWRRMLVVPFKVRVPDEKIDRDLDKKLRAESEGILNWIIEGAEAWFDQGLNPPLSSTSASEEYRADENPVGRFIDACCDPLVKPGGDYTINPATGKPYETTFKALRDSYEAHCEEVGIDPISPKAFGSKLAGMGYEKRSSNGIVYYKDIWLRTADPLKAENS